MDRSELENLEDIKIVSYVEKKLLSVQDLIKSYESQDEFGSLAKLLWRKELFKELLKKQLVDREDVCYLLRQLTAGSEVRALFQYDELKTISLFQYIVKQNLFRALIDSCERIRRQFSTTYDEMLFVNSEISEQFSNGSLSQEEMLYLINKLSGQRDLIALVQFNTDFTKQLFSSFLLTDEIVDKYEDFLANSEYYRSNGIRTVFDLIDQEIWRYDEDMKALNTVHRKLFEMFDSSEREVLCSIARTTERSQKILMQVVKNNLLSQYDFNQLVELITKDDRKKKIKMNF